MSSIKLSDFKANLAQVVRPNRFFVEIQPPSVYAHETDLQSLQFFVQGAKIPEKTIGEIDIKFRGMSLKLPGDYTTSDLTITFLNHYNWDVRDFFEDWIEVIQNISNDNKRTDAIAVIDDSSIVVKQIGDTKEDVLAEYTFYDVFPKSVSEIDLSMDQDNSVETFTVTFAYSHWVQV